MPSFSFDPRIEGEGFASLLFPRKASLLFPSEEGIKEIFCGSLNASFNASSEEVAKGEAFPGWDPGYVGTCVPYAEACRGPYPFKDPRRDPFRKALSSTTPKGGFKRVSRIGTGARSDVRPKRLVRQKSNTPNRTISYIGPLIREHLWSKSP